MMHYFTFAGKNSQDFGIRISGESTYNRPKRKYNEYKVPGRNGTLIIDEDAFENIPVSYPSYIVEDMPDKIEAFVNYISSLSGYQRLEDTYSPEVFRLGQYSSGLDVESSGYMNRHGKFEISFNCKPQRFLKKGEQVIIFNAAGNMYNETQYAAKPLIRVYGSGAGTVGIGSETITISAISQYVDIDCEIMDAFKGAINCNANVSYSDDMIVIPSGSCGVNFTGNISRVEITPRWWII